MKRFLAIAAVACVVFSTGCAQLAGPPQRFSLAPVRANGQDFPPNLDSSTILESRQPGGVVSVKAMDDFADFGASFVVAFHNKSATAYDFGPGNVVATANGHKLAVLGAQELDARAKGRARGYIRANTKFEEVDLETASETSNREYRFNNYGGCPAGKGDCHIMSDDNGRGYRTDRINREIEAETIADVATNLAINTATIAKAALQTRSVGPEQLYGGIIIVEPPREGGPVDLTVTVNGRTHRFGFIAKPAA